MSIIYLITNNVNGKRYVGKTKKTANQRFKRHKYSAVEPKTYLHKALAKYGFENFKIEVLEECTNLDQRERHWIKTLKPEYNMTIGGDGGDTSSSPNYVSGMKKRRDMSGSNNPMYGRKRDNSAFLAKATAAMTIANRCPVVCEGTQYASVGDAQVAYPGCNIRKRLDNPKYPDFYRLRDRTLRK